MIDPQPYEIFLAQLRGEVDKLETARVQVAREYSQGLVYPRVFYPLTQESLILERQWKDMNNYLIQAKKMNNYLIQAKKISVTHNR